ncbi:hypothetical protein FKM82_011532 [Ascaphus truei]
MWSLATATSFWELCPSTSNPKYSPFYYPIRISDFISQSECFILQAKHNDLFYYPMRILHCIIQSECSILSMSQLECSVLLSNQNTHHYCVSCLNNPYHC